MATTRVDALLLDTNVLLTATTPSRLGHAVAVQILEGSAGDGSLLCTSSQIIREYLAVSTRPTTANGLDLSLRDALDNVAALLARLRVLDEDRLVLERLRNLLAEVTCTGRQIHDANLIATMLRHGVSTLVTADAGDFTRFTDRIAVRDLASFA